MNLIYNIRRLFQGRDDEIAELRRRLEFRDKAAKVTADRMNEHAQCITDLRKQLADAELAASKAHGYMVEELSKARERVRDLKIEVQNMHTQFHTVKDLNERLLTEVADANKILDELDFDGRLRYNRKQEAVNIPRAAGA